MTHRLGDLVSGDWLPRGASQSDFVPRLAALAAEVVAMGRSQNDPASVFFVPGRIEVLGKHTDYAGGRSLVAATEQGLLMVSCPRQDARIRMLDTRRRQSIVLEANAAPAGATETWSLYPKRVVERLSQAVDRPLTGTDIAFESSLPTSAGLSSSSVLVVGTFMALQRSNRLDGEPAFRELLQSRLDLAAYLGAVESGRSFGPFQTGEGVGTRGGDQDHTAILCAGRNQMRQFRFLPTVQERTLIMPPGFVFGVAVSGVRARKTGLARDDYNRVSDLAARLEEILGSKQMDGPPTLGAIVRDSQHTIESFEASLEDSLVRPQERRDLYRRLHQFIRESEEIIPAAGEALAQGDLVTFGKRVDESMYLAIEFLENQIEETVRLASSARDLGAVAASGFGAGFGGAVWALVRRDGVEEFLERWSHDYLSEFPEHRKHAQFLKTVAGGPAAEL